MDDFDIEASEEAVDDEEEEKDDKVAVEDFVIGKEVGEGVGGKDENGEEEANREGEADAVAATDAVAVAAVSVADVVTGDDVEGEREGGMKVSGLVESASEDGVTASAMDAPFLAPLTVTDMVFDFVLLLPSRFLSSFCLRF